MCNTAIAQWYTAIFECSGTITSDCERQQPIEHVARVVIFHDWDQNGRSVGDRPICAGFCIPEESMANFYEFYVDSTNGFASPLFEVILFTESPDFYLCLYPWPSENIEWVSPNIVLVPSDLENPQHISLPFADWTCGSPQFARPPCSPSPSYISANNAEEWPNPVCIRSCPGAYFLVRVVDGLGINTPYRIQPLQLLQGCDGSLPARAEPRLSDLWWSDWFGYLVEYVSLDRGYIELSYLDSPPCGSVDTFTVEREGTSVRIRWNTLAETSLSHFEIWSNHAAGPMWFRHVSDVPALDNPEGAAYEYLEENVETHYKWYTLVQVAEDSLRYPDMRAYLPWATVNTDVPDKLIPTSARLLGSYPNPFNATTKIEFELPTTATISLQVFDVNGRLVQTLVDEATPAGRHSVTFDGNNLASGLYFARLAAGEFHTTQKMVLLK